MDENPRDRESRHAVQRLLAEFAFHKERGLYLRGSASVNRIRGQEQAGRKQLLPKGLRGWATLLVLAFQTYIIAVQTTIIGKQSSANEAEAQAAIEANLLTREIEAPDVSLRVVPYNWDGPLPVVFANTGKGPARNFRATIGVIHNPDPVDIDPFARERNHWRRLVAQIKGHIGMLRAHPVSAERARAIADLRGVARRESIPQPSLETSWIPAGSTAGLNIPQPIVGNIPRGPDEADPERAIMVYGAYWYEDRFRDPRGYWARFCVRYEKAARRWFDCLPPHQRPGTSRKRLDGF